MFRQPRRHAPWAPASPTEGSLYWVAQDFLGFGSNANEERDKRPVYCRKRNGPHIPVLPSTSHPGNPEDFYHLPSTEEHIEFTSRAIRGREFNLSRDYETLSRHAFDSELRIGTARAHIRHRIQEWLVGHAYE